MAGYKMVSIVLLVVLVALAGVSPAFALKDNLIITPTAGCPGTKVSVTGYFVALAGGLSLDSDPYGLLADRDCEALQGSGGYGAIFACTFVVTPIATSSIGDSACPGTYTVTMTLTNDLDVIVGSASAQFTVGQQCPTAPFCSTAPVGGCVQPANTFALVSPWLALIGLVGCIGTVAVVARKRRP